MRNYSRRTIGARTRYRTPATFRIRKAEGVKRARATTKFVQSRKGSSSLRISL